jgi:hypothetical protein
MKINPFALILLCFCIALNIGCSKSDPSPVAGGGGSSNPSTDPAVIILGRWQVVKDSIVVVNFAFSNGYIPIPGVYIGNANDYWLFQNNGTVYIYEGGSVGTTAYQLQSATSLLIPAFEWGDITIRTLTNSSFIWEKSMTSSNGGTYYRKAYLRK